MKENVTVAVLADYFIEWGGGVDFLCNCLNALTLNSKSKPINLILLYPKKNVLAESLLRYKFMIKDLIKLRKPKMVIPTRIGEKYVLRSIRNVSPNIQVVYYENSSKGLVSIVDKIKADVVIPAARSLGTSFPIPWIGYIFDLQHKYLEEYFNHDDILGRDRVLNTILQEAKAVIVNSKSVKEDILKFYPNTECEIFNLPFSPIPVSAWFDHEAAAITKKYKLPERYFVISNQFWIHKSHLTAFEALSKLKGPNVDCVHIICTGKTEDYRFPDYINNLKERIEILGMSKRIHFLGYIPKIDQIQIMQNSIGVLQPTLFEGGPGGGAVFDAVALGVPAIVSDIPVNVEIESEIVMFFKAGSSDDLAMKMADLMDGNLMESGKEKLLADGQRRCQALGDRLFEAIEFVLEAE